MRMKDQIRFLNFIIGDDMDFYEEYIVHLSDDEQQEFFVRTQSLCRTMP